MPQAWQVREMQQQEFVKSLRDLIDKEEEERGELFAFAVMLVLTRYLGYRTSDAGKLEPRGFKDSSEDSQLTDAENFFQKAILEKTIAFARMESEELYLLTKLFKELPAWLCGRFVHGYHEEAARVPRRAYRAESATEEIELPKGLE